MRISIPRRSHILRRRSVLVGRRSGSRAMHCLSLFAFVLALAQGAHSQTSPAPLPNAPSAGTLQQRPQFDPSLNYNDPVVIIHGRPYTPPTQRQLFNDYLRDTYGLPALARTTVRTLYNEGVDTPVGWGQDFPGFLQRFGSNAGITIINGNVRYGMEEIFHEDLRYIPCHGCNFKHKIENALLAEITARHDADGHRFFTLTPTVADFSGPIIAHVLWYPPTASGDPALRGVIGARTVFATRIGSHLFREFVLERRHHDVAEPARGAPKPLPGLGEDGNP
jgi:hypothetical protein